MTARLAAAIVLMLGAGTAAGTELGRLFFTPAQRATLDRMREKNSGTETAGDKEPAPRNVSLDGVVRRSDGKNTVWLNHRAVSSRQADGIGVSTGKYDNRVKLTVPESGRSFDLKVGQTAEIVSGTIAESYARRAPLPKPEAKTVPGAESAASGTAKVTPPPASQPVESTATVDKGPTRAGERDSREDPLPNRRQEPK